MENKTVLQQLSEWVEKEKKISLNLRDGGGLVAFELMSKKIKEIESKLTKENKNGNNIITLKPTKLVAVVVPKFSEDYFSVNGSVLRYLVDDISGSDGNPVFDEINLGQDNYIIIGTCTKEGVLDFDPVSICLNCERNGFTVDVEAVCCGNYKEYGCCGIPTPEQVQNQCNCTEHFLSLFPANGVYLKNPMGDKPQKGEFIDKIWCKTGECKAYFDSLEEWQSYQSKTLPEQHKFVILKPGK